jgi:hypothetical protein
VWVDPVGIVDTPGHPDRVEVDREHEVRPGVGSVMTIAGREEGRLAGRAVDEALRREGCVGVVEGRRSGLPDRFGYQVERRSHASMMPAAPYHHSMTATRYPIRLGARSRPLLRLFGVRGVENAYVDLDASTVRAHFGRFEVTTPVANLASWRIEGPWLWITAIGVRMSLRHRDLSFAGSPRGGVRLDFREPVRLGPLHIPALYVGVEDLVGLGAALAALGVPGEDARNGHR